MTKSIANKFKQSRRKASAVPLQAAVQPVRSPATADGGGGEVRGQVQQVKTIFCSGALAWRVLHDSRQFN